MANQKISARTIATSLSGTEKIPLGVAGDKATTPNQIASHVLGSYIVEWTFAPSGNFPTTPNKLYIAVDAHGNIGDADYVAPGTWFVPISATPSTFAHFKYK